MEFTELDAKGYRSLDTEAYQTRRAMVLELAGNMPEDATDEQIRSIDAELDYIKSEDSRRDNLVELRNHKAAQVIMGAGETVAKSDPAKVETEHRNMTLGGRVWDEFTKRGGMQGEQIRISNIPAIITRDGEGASEPVVPTASTNLNPLLTTDYGKDTLEAVDPTIREGYRQELSIESLFRAESTDKDAVSFYVEGSHIGGPGMTAEAGKYSQVEFLKPEKKTASLKKETVFWKNSDEIMSDSPRFIAHINSKAPYLFSKFKEEQLISGDGTGNNITGLLNTSGLQTKTYTSLDMAFIDKLLEYQDDIYTATPNFVADTLLVSHSDYFKLLQIKDPQSQYVLGGPTSMIYGANVSPIRTVWNNIRIIPSRALSANTMVLGNFSQGGCVVNHTDGRRFEMAYDGEDFTHGLVTFRMSERFVLNVEYPAAFMKLTKAGATGATGATGSTS